MENLDHCDRLGELELYSLERRKERYYILYGWLEGIKENVLNLKESERSSRLTVSPKIPEKNEVQHQ